MAVKLRIGNSLQMGIPAQGNIRMVRSGDRMLSSYEYNTWNLQALNASFPASKHIVVDEVKRFFDRAGKGESVPPKITDPRMTTGATMFAVMDRDVETPDRYYIRPSGDNYIREFIDLRSWGANTDKDETIGLNFRVYRDGAAPVAGNVAYFDNSRVLVSNILWEFSSDGGKNKWYQLYDLPNRAYTRVTLPDPTNRLRVRALSNNPQEWVQAFAVSPKVDYQNSMSRDFAWSVSGGGLSIDGFGYMTWSRAVGGYGSAIYHVYQSDGYELGRTRDLHWRLDEYDSSKHYYVQATDAAGGEISTATV